MRPLKHGYTNRTLGDGAVVRKTYEGPDAALRLQRERALLTGLRDRLPVPPVRAVSADTLTLGFVPGVPGQELLDGGHAAAVLAACGEVLRRIHSVAQDVLPESARAADAVLVHGDFGPNNLLLDPGTFAVTAIVDWEFARHGAPVEDLAWCEWLVRTHHPGHLRALGGFFRAYGGKVPPWPERRAAMLAKCAEMREFCERWEPGGPGVRLWEDRAAATAGWAE
ncbi:phosphotransferase [Streptomyces sp. WMMC500]|uniref:phosphotransferase family protein n=1 Tax=Streptomyces sp. WMMC500 TaxID=3015154 RepID=UPI00248C22A7|nr:phosphotransferase [Streptomyces sp. WMMC500]WBB58202.1 phosphotransferase [Streptomyces sp. WMMC500]